MIANIFLRIFLVATLLVPAAMQESPVIAEITVNCKVHSDKALNFPIGELSAGQLVEILEDYSYEVYKVLENISGTSGWIKSECLKIPCDTPTDRSILTRRQLENFANENNFASKTNYLIITDINRQKTHIFTKNDSAWVLIRSFDCSTGLNASPTTRGTFTISDRGTWFYSERLNSGAAHWLRFNGQYLFHSIPMDRHKNIIDGEDIVGEKRSSGCVRLMPEDAKWLYDNIPGGTTAIII